MSYFNNINVGVTGFVFDSRYTFTGLGYLAICWQKQWGYSGYAVNFPISFGIVYNVLSIPQNTASTSNSYWGRFYITNLTKNGFTVSDTGAGSNRWLAIGKAQPQWGINTGGAVQTSTLPITFTNVFLAVASTSTEWCCPGCSATNTTVTTRAYQSNRPDVAQPNDVNWIVIGCQPQWGYYVESQNPTDYRYWSIPFTSHYITMATKTYYEPKEEAVPWLVGIDMQKFICGYGANFIGSSYVSCVGIGCQLQWGYYTAAVGAIYTDVTTPVSFSKCFIAESIDTLLAASTTWPGTTQTVWNINASNVSKIRFIWSRPPVELDGAVWFGIFI